MDIVIVIIIALVTIFGKAASQQKKKQEQERREASARGVRTPPPFDPRFPPEERPHASPQGQQPLSRADWPETEGEPAEELPVRPPAVQMPNVRMEGGAPAQRSVIMPQITVAAHLEATKGRRAMLEHGEQVHAHIESSMERRHHTVRAQAEQQAAPRWNMDPVQSAITRLGHDPKAVAEGVVMSEILGKPKALRR